MTTAFVLGGGGVLGTTQLGMLRALAELAEERGDGTAAALAWKRAAGE